MNNDDELYLETEVKLDKGALAHRISQMDDDKIIEFIMSILDDFAADEELTRRLHEILDKQVALWDAEEIIEGLVNGVQS